METYEYIIKKYNIDSFESPISLPHRRDDLARLFGELGFKVGAEIGVDRGLYAEELCKNNPGVKLFCIDPWKVYNQYADMKDQHYLNVNHLNTGKRLAPYNCEIIRKSSMGAIGDFKPESLDFVYIDGNHSYKYVLEDCNGWSKIVRPGGIVSGHDYTTRRHPNVGLDVKMAIDQHIEENHIDPFFVYREKGSSTWFYVKS